MDQFQKKNFTERIDRLLNEKYGREDNPARFTKDEKEILLLTEEIWNRFLKLPVNHPMEVNEIAMKIHDIQRMIISRPTFRMNRDMFINDIREGYGKGNSDM